MQNLAVVHRGGEYALANAGEEGRPINNPIVIRNIQRDLGVDDMGEQQTEQHYQTVHLRGETVPYTAAVQSNTGPIFQLLATVPNHAWTIAEEHEEEEVLMAPSTSQPQKKPERAVVIDSEGSSTESEHEAEQTTQPQPVFTFAPMHAPHGTSETMAETPTLPPM